MRTFGLVGRNIDYSFSRKYFSDKFEREHLKDEYRNFDIPGIKHFPEILQNNILAGLNVTIPYKEEIIPYLDHLDPHAKKIQAVNTIRFEKDGSLTGYNTDYWGFLEALKPNLKPHHNSALILGTGGASKAVAYTLELLNIAFDFVSRNAEEDQLNYDELDADIIRKYPLIINTTPLGTSPNILESPQIPYQYITSDHLVFDLIYNPAETQFMKLAAENGAATLNGLQMLKFQAERAWDIWNS